MCSNPLASVGDQQRFVLLKEDAGIGEAIRNLWGRSTVTLQRVGRAPGSGDIPTHTTCQRETRGAAKNANHFRGAKWLHTSIRSAANKGLCRTGGHS
jgi:hypothetical protein